MIAAFKQFFAMFTSFFSAGQHVASSLDKLATVGDLMAEQYLAEQQHALQQRVLQLTAETAKVKALTKA